MAKSKKTEETPKPAAKKTAAATAPKEAKATKAAPAKKASEAAAAAPAAPAAKKPAKAGKPTAGGPPQSPLIDTGLAAQTAAAMVASGFGPAGSKSTTQPESSTFKNLKESLSKPTMGGLGGILGTGGGQKKFTPNFSGGKQGGPGGGRNQTFGADVNRSGVPRRTNG